MTDIQFGQYSFKLKNVEGKEMIWDILRHKYIVLTPEERVRQTIVHYLITTKGYSKNLIAIERAAVTNDNKRFDIVLFNQETKPILLVECKSPSVKIDLDTFLQSGKYNINIQAPYIWLSNGHENFIINSYTQTVLDSFPLI
jgi:type I site-specific restriction endonuclease